MRCIAIADLAARTARTTLTWGTAPAAVLLIHPHVALPFLTLVVDTRRGGRNEAERQRLFPLWRVALEAAGGNITQAGEMQDPPINRDQAEQVLSRYVRVNA